ncbi:hypothetical protein CGRA01v4_02119 [Colletotrichum graminicola]|nr:hypothetical protein CGRA01v4_02119 [Colletotrichum graminicola]
MTSAHLAPVIGWRCCRLHSHSIAPLCFLDHVRQRSSNAPPFLLHFDRIAWGPSDAKIPREPRY